MPRKDIVVYDRPPERPPEPPMDYPSSASNGLLWLAVLGGPAAWSLDSLASFFLHQSWCAGRTTHRELPFEGIFWFLIAVGLLMGLAAVGAGWLGLRAHRDTGADTGRADTSFDRRRFMAHSGMLMSVLFLFGIVLRFIAVFFIDPHICNVGS